MTEQQYRVIADRDKGDDPQWYDAEVGDRVTSTVTSRYPSDPRNAEVVCIERPVPTTDEPKQGVSTDRLRDMADLLDGLLNRVTLRQAADELDRLRSSVPTREQIAEAIYEVHDSRGDEYEAMADAVLALLNGADRD